MIEIVICCISTKNIIFGRISCLQEYNESNFRIKNNILIETKSKCPADIDPR